MQSNIVKNYGPAAIAVGVLTVVLALLAAALSFQWFVFYFGLVVIALMVAAAVVRQRSTTLPPRSPSKRLRIAWLIAVSAPLWGGGLSTLVDGRSASAVIGIATILYLCAAIGLLAVPQRIGFPSWARIIAGGMLIIPVVLAGFLMLAGGAGAGAPSDAATVKYEARVNATTSPYSIREEIEVRPHDDYSVVRIHELLASRDPLTGLIRESRFRVDTVRGQAAYGLRLVREYPLHPREESLGFLRTKLFVPIPDLVVKVGRRGVTPIIEDSLEDVMFGSLDQTSFGIRVEFPKNAFLSAYPTGTLVKLPDKDIVEFKLVQPEPVEIYLLSHLRFAVVRDALSEASGSDTIVKGAAFLIWPVVLLLLSTMHKGFADWVTSRLQQRRVEPKKSIGFDR